MQWLIMDSDPDENSLLKFYRNIIARFKKALSFCKTSLLRNNNIAKIKPVRSFKPSNILHRIKQQHTWSVNKYFLGIIFSSLLLVIVTSYFEQNYKFKQQLKIKTELSHNKITETINSYFLSLKVLAKLFLDQKRYLSPNKIQQILKFTYIKDNNIKLLPVSWHEAIYPYKVYNIYGASSDNPDQALLSALSKAPGQLLIRYNIDSLGSADLILYYPVTAKGANKLADIPNKLLGYFKLPIKASIFLQSLSGTLNINDLLKIIQQEKILHFSKQQTEFDLNKNIKLSKIQFADPILSLPYDYYLTVGHDRKVMLINALSAISSRCSIIIILGGIMMYAYNYVERKKIKDSYKRLFVDQFTTIKDQLKTQADKLTLAEIQIKKLEQSKEYFIESAKFITQLEQHLNQANQAALVKLRDYNHLLIKHYSKEKVLKPEIIEDILTNIYHENEALHYNITCQNDKTTFIDLADIIPEGLAIFRPVIEARSIKIINQVKTLKITANLFLLKQILISLFAKSLYSLAKHRQITFIATRDKIGDKVTIEIIDNGLGINEELLEDILYNRKKDLLPGLMHMQISFEGIKHIIKEKLNGDVEVVSSDEGSKIILLLPLKRYQADNIISLAKIMRGKS